MIEIPEFVEAAPTLPLRGGRAAVDARSHATATPAATVTAAATPAAVPIAARPAATGAEAVPARATPAPAGVPSPLKSTAAQWLRQRRAAIEVRVVRHQGSVPRETGTRMLVAADAVAGTIGGGHLELKAIDEARQMLRAAAASGGPVAPRERHYPLGPALGQCCGGAVTLGFAPLGADALAAWPDERPLFTLQLYGAGHVGRAIVRLLEGLPCRVQWIDERESEFPPPAAPGAHPHIERVCVEPVEAEVDEAPPGAFYLVLTHSHDLDLRITEAILKRGDFAFAGLIGSKTKRARFLRRFEQRGIPADVLARLTCPIGVPGIDGKAPETIAIAVVAQLLQQAGG